MDEFVILFILGILLAIIVLPIVALVVAIHTKRKLNAQLARLATGSSAQQPDNSHLAILARRVKQLEVRTEKIEVALGVRATPLTEVTEPPERPVKAVSSAPVAEPFADSKMPPPPTAPTRPIAHPSPKLARQAADLESIIGRRWVGWIAVGLILFATAFFLKYAFDNRWIGELGRVAIGVAAGLSLTVFGFRYHQRGWRVFSQILTAGGVVLLYVSVYAAFGYYHLVSQKAAFTYLLILIAETAGLAILYNAQSIAIMALIGGFLTPVLLRSSRDQYASLFGYITALNIGALALPRRWIGINFLAFSGTHLLFWLWYEDNYHPKKLSAVMTFQAATFLIFLVAPLGRRLIKREPATHEDLYLLPINGFVFFVTAHHLLDTDYHDWMGILALVMALIYSGAAKILLDREATTRMEVLAMISIAIVFVTLAIPIQFEANWITIAWSVQALLMLWVGIRIKSALLHASAYLIFILAVGKLIVWDTPFDYRPIFTPVVNKYFLSSLVVTVCLFGAVALYQKWADQRRLFTIDFKPLVLLLALGTLWFVMSVETFTFFRAKAARLKDADDVYHQLWLGQMALSVLWSVYAGAMAALGFIRRSAVMRWAALGLFGLTVLKVMLIDIAQLKQLYRIIAFLVLGVLLLIVAWGYHKAFRNKESQGVVK